MDTFGALDVPKDTEFLPGPDLSRGGGKPVDHRVATAGAGDVDGGFINLGAAVRPHHEGLIGGIHAGADLGRPMPGHAYLVIPVTQRDVNGTDVVEIPAQDRALAGRELASVEAKALHRHRLRVAP
jgi:hypothetical protein